MANNLAQSKPSVRKDNETVYECTFSCKQHFTDFEKWKTHEIEQHGPEAELHYFVCQEFIRRPDYHINTRCGLAIRGEDQFLRHLTEHHRAFDVEMNECSISAAHGFGYWCGFCNSVKSLSINKPVSRARYWNSRASHIQVHFEVEKKVCAYGGWKLAGESAAEREAFHAELERSTRLP